MHDFVWIVQIAAAVTMLGTYTVIVRKYARLEMIVARLLHHTGLDENGNPRDGHRNMDSDLVRSIVREGINDGTINIDSGRKRSGA